MRYLRGFLAVTLLCSLGWLLFAPEGSNPVRSQRPTPQISGAIRAPDGYTPPPLTLSPSAADIQSVGLKAVAIVGDVGEHTSQYKTEMNDAVAVLEARGATVTKFYYGDSSFSWSDIVAASTGAHFLLYMGHGVYGGSDCSHPTSVGGFCLGNGEFVSSDQIRNDLGGRIADESVVIFSHACFTAGNSGCDDTGSGWPSQAEAERRIRMYAEPFSDIGMQAYYANNYYYSATQLVTRLLEDPATRKNEGEIFKNTYPNNPADFKDSTYPQSGYDLWLNGTPGNWHFAFVGLPEHIFAADIVPQLGGLPASLTFTYEPVTATFTPDLNTVTPANLTNGDSIAWSLDMEGAWFTAAPSTGATPDAFTVTPIQTVAEGLPSGTYTGAITVTATDPPDTQNPVQRVDLTLTVNPPPLLGNLPNALTFTYHTGEGQWLPSAATLTPANLQGDVPLHWTVSALGDGFTITPMSGITPESFTIQATTALSATGLVTVTVTAPDITEGSPHVISVQLLVVDTPIYHAFLPCVLRRQ
ncbi:MAG: hypothetical protein J7M17_02200 [Anaerolineae bacterium]|nr:hypothetical protein [Anaerolineae bacterium]